MQVKNAVFNATGGIDCEIEHPLYGWIPFTASADDVEEHGRDIFAALEGSAAPYMPSDDPAPVPAVICRFQARAALLDAGLLADVELALADAEPLAQLAWAEAIEWRRDSPTIAAIGAALDLTPEQIDDLFRTAAQITA